MTVFGRLSNTTIWKVIYSNDNIYCNITEWMRLYLQRMKRLNSKQNDAVMKNFTHLLKKLIWSLKCMYYLDNIFLIWKRFKSLICISIRSLYTYLQQLLSVLLLQMTSSNSEIENNFYQMSITNLLETQNFHDLNVKHRVIWTRKK